MNLEIPVEAALIRKPQEDPFAHSHVYSDIKEITENDVLEFPFPEESRVNPLITWTNIKITWPREQQLVVSYYIVALTPHDVIRLSPVTPVRCGEWLSLREPIPGLPLEDSQIVVVLNIEQNRHPELQTWISMKLTGFDHLIPYNQSTAFAEGWTLVDMGLKGRFVPQ